MLQHTKPIQPPGTSSVLSWLQGPLPARPLLQMQPRRCSMLRPTWHSCNSTSSSWSNNLNKYAV